MTHHWHQPATASLHRQAFPNASRIGRQHSWRECYRVNKIRLGLAAWTACACAQHRPAFEISGGRFGPLGARRRREPGNPPVQAGRHADGSAHGVTSVDCGRRAATPHGQATRSTLPASRSTTSTRPAPCSCSHRTAAASRHGAPAVYLPNARITGPDQHCAAHGPPARRPPHHGRPRPERSRQHLARIAPMPPPAVSHPHVALVVKICRVLHADGACTFHARPPIRYRGPEGRAPAHPGRARQGAPDRVWHDRCVRRRGSCAGNETAASVERTKRGRAGRDFQRATAWIACPDSRSATNAAARRDNRPAPAARTATDGHGPPPHPLR